MRLLNKILFLIFANLVVATFTAGLLMVSLPSGSLWLFRLASALVLIAFNFVMIKKVDAVRFFHENTDRGMLSIAALLLIIGSAVFSYNVFVEPHGMWDAWAIHHMKAKYYALTFLEARPVSLYWDWWEGNPSFFSMQLAFFSILIGKWSLAIPIILSYLYYIMTFAVMLNFCSRESVTRKYVSYIVLICTSLSPALIQQASNQCADAPLTFFYLFSYFALFNYFACVKDEADDCKPNSEGNFFIFIAIVSASLLPLVKNEGTLLALPLLIFLFYMLVRNKAWRILSASLLTCLFFLAVFIYIKTSVGKVYLYKLDLGTIIDNIKNPKRYAVILAYFGFTAFVFWGGLLVYMLYHARHLGLKILLTFIVPFFLYHLVFVIIQQELVHQLNVAYVRIISHFYPALFLAALYSSSARAPATR